jgi:hypothetical protein
MPHCMPHCKASSPACPSPWTACLLQCNFAVQVTSSHVGGPARRCSDAPGAQPSWPQICTHRWCVGRLFGPSGPCWSGLLAEAEGPLPDGRLHVLRLAQPACPHTPPRPLDGAGVSQSAPGVPPSPPHPQSHAGTRSAGHGGPQQLLRAPAALPQRLVPRRQQQEGPSLGKWQKRESPRSPAAAVGARAGCQGPAAGAPAGTGLS